MATYNNTLIFIGNGANGTKKTDEFNNNLTEMGLSHYFAVTKEGEKKYKTISSEKSRAGGSAEAHTVYNLDPSTGGEDAFAERLDKFIAYVDKEVVKKGIKRDDLVDNFGEQHGFLPQKLKLRSVQSGALQIVLNYNIDNTSNNNVEGTGRIQFVENRGMGAVSSAMVMGEIIIKNGKYNFVFDDDKTTKDAAVAAVKAKNVIEKLGVKMEFKPDMKPNPPPPAPATAIPPPPPPRAAIVTPRPSVSNDAAAIGTALQKAKIVEQVDLASAAAAAAKASAERVKSLINNTFSAGGSRASDFAKTAMKAATGADEAYARAIAANDNGDYDAVNDARTIAEDFAKDAETAAVAAVAAVRPPPPPPPLLRNDVTPSSSPPGSPRSTADADDRPPPPPGSPRTRTAADAGSTSQFGDAALKKNAKNAKNANSGLDPHNPLVKAMLDEAKDKRIEEERKKRRRAIRGDSDSDSDSDDSEGDWAGGGKKRKTHRKKAKKNKSKRAKAKKTKAKKAKGGKRTIKRRRKPKRGKC